VPLIKIIIQPQRPQSVMRNNIPLCSLWLYSFLAFFAALRLCVSSYSRI